MTRTSYERVQDSATFRLRYPELERLHVYRVAETRFAGWVGCDLLRVAWLEGDEKIVFTAPTLIECEAFAAAAALKVRGWDLLLEGK